MTSSKPLAAFRSLGEEVLGEVLCSAPGQRGSEILTVGLYHPKERRGQITFTRRGYAELYT